MVNFIFKFVGEDVILFQHNYSKPFNLIDKTLEFSSPDGSKFIFKEANNTFPNKPLDLNNLPTYFDHSILGDLDEWGFQEGKGMYIDLDNVQKDSIYFSGMYIKNGVPSICKMEKFPIGLYKVTYSYKEKEIIQTSSTPNIISYSETKYIVNDLFVQKKLNEFLNIYIDGFNKGLLNKEKYKDLEVIIDSIIYLTKSIEYKMKYKLYKEVTDLINALSKLMSFKF